MVEDRVTVGLTPDGEENLETVMESEFFDEELVAYRTAVAVALASDEVTDPERMKNVRTKYNVGSLDRGGEIRELVELLRPAHSEGRVYSYAERLADAGLRILSDHLSDDQPLMELLGRQG